MVLQQQNPAGMMQSGLPLQPQSTQLQQNIPQQQVGANQTSPLLAQQLAGRPPAPGQPGMIQGQAGPMMQQRPSLLPEQQIRAQLQTVAQNTGTSQTATSTPVTSTGGDGPSVSSEDLEGLGDHELGDLGMGDGDFLDMGDDFNIFEFTDAMDDLDDMPGEDNKTAATMASSSSSSNEPSVTNDTSNPSAATTVSSALVSTTVSSAPVGAISTSTITNNPNNATSNANAGMMNAAGHLVNQPPPYTAAGSVTVPLRGALPQGTVAGVMPGATTTIIRGPPPPYPGPGLPPNASPLTAGGPTNISTSKVRNIQLIFSNFSSQFKHRIFFDIMI